MPTKTAKSRTAAPPVTKICMKCQQTRLLKDFYSNRDWVDQLGRDVWCKTCVGKCKTKDDLRGYFWENNREWSERLWMSSVKKAELAANKNSVYQKTTDERRKLILEQLACQHMIKAMQVNYKFVDNSKNVNVQNYQEAKEAGQIVAKEKEEDPNVKHYSEFFNGSFKTDELKHLNQYYEELKGDFDLNDVNLRDTAKKLAKQSLICDRIQDKYAAGQASLADVKDAFALYDMLSKSGNFAACKRKPEEKPDENSFSQMVDYCEKNGHPCIKKIEWEKDVVDTALDGLYYILEAIRDEAPGIEGDDE